MLLELAAFNAGFATVKATISAGRDIASAAAAIGKMVDNKDAMQQRLSKKKNSVFSSANEEAMATWTQAQNAKTAETELREFIVNTKGFSAYQDLLKVRREVIAQRKEAEKQAALEAEERQELIMSILVILLLVIAVVGGFGFWLQMKGYIDL